ncbi:MAG TPA: hypothetical protein VI958_01840, partial [Acidobacteriota bacterium]
RAPIVDNSDAEIRFEGLVATIQDAYCFARILDLNTDVFIHHSQFGDGAWEHVHINRRLQLSVKFNFRGPAGSEVDLA